jgi:hypothetical protein
MKSHLFDLQQFTPPHWVKTLFKGALLRSAAIISYQSATAQTLYSAVNAETQMINGPYANIDNTGNYLAPCSQCPNDYMHVMTWDGDDPAVSFSDGNVTIVAALPSNINDPDIVVGLDGRVAMVAYVTSSGNLEYKLYTVTLPLTWSTTPTISSATTVATSARHPNLDLNLDDVVALVWQMPNSTSTNPDIEYNVGDLTSSGVTWNTSGPFPGDNKLNISYPMQNNGCLMPDIAISGGTNYGVHITFLENISSGVYEWWKMDDDFSSSIVWHNSFYTGSTSSKFSPPRIACSRGAFNDEYFVAVLTDLDTTINNERVLAVNDNSNSGSIFANQSMFPTGRFRDAIVAWVDDEYVNVAWSMDDNYNTTDFDIAVKRLDHTGQPLDYTWAIANQTTSGVQHIPSISGVGIGMPYGNPGQFAYLWVDDNDELWHKVVPAPDAQLKWNPNESTTESFNLFPNPSAFSVAVQLGSKNTNVSYQLFDLKGKLLQGGEIAGSIGYINIGELPIGTYLVTVTSDQICETQRLVKL